MGVGGTSRGEHETVCAFHLEGQLRTTKGPEGSCEDVTKLVDENAEAVSIAG